MGAPGEQFMLGAQRKTTVCVGETSKSHTHRQIQGWGLCLEGELESQPSPYSCEKLGRYSDLSLPLRICRVSYGED